MNDELHPCHDRATCTLQEQYRHELPRARPLQPGDEVHFHALDGSHVGSIVEGPLHQQRLTSNFNDPVFLLEAGAPSSYETTYTAHAYKVRGISRRVRGKVFSIEAVALSHFYRKARFGGFMQRFWRRL